MGTYAELVLEGFYQIKFESQADRDDINSFFTGAGHAFWRCVQARGSRFEGYHKARLFKHVACLKSIVYDSGDFENAIDKSGGLLAMRESWDPFLRTLPDEEMFEAFRPNEDCGIGAEHPNDKMLFDLVPHLFA